MALFKHLVRESAFAVDWDVRLLGVSSKQSSSSNSKTAALLPHTLHAEGIRKRRNLYGAWGGRRVRGMGAVYSLSCIAVVV